MLMDLEYLKQLGLPLVGRSDAVQKCMPSEAVLKRVRREKIKLEELLCEIDKLEQQLQDGKVALNPNQKAKLARKPALESSHKKALAEFLALAAPRVVTMPGGFPAYLLMSHTSMPSDLDVAHISPALAMRALQELLPRMASTDCTGVNSPPEVLEIGWSFYEAQFHMAWVEAVPLTEVPELHRLLVDAMQALHSKPLAMERVNVICRHYRKDRGIALHTDVPDLFEEDVYGCVLENTSDTALEFRCPKNGHIVTGYRLQEHPGMCFRQRGEARYDWWHGVNPVRTGERFSVTWRWFRAECVDALKAQSNGKPW